MNVLNLFAQNDQTGATHDLLGLACAGILWLFFYLLPAFIAAVRGHQNTAAIFVLTLLLGWTILGWVIAFVWSFAPLERPGHGGRSRS